MNRRAAFFDLDGTLIMKPSCERRFLKRLWQKRLLGHRQVLAGLLFYPRWFARYGLDVGRKNKAFLSGLAVAEVEQEAEYWVTEHFEALQYRAVVDQLERCREQGYTLVLLTGAPEFLARPIAQNLQMHDCIATRCVTRAGRFCAAPPLIHPLSQEKLQLARQWCEHQGVKLEDCAAYGDSHQDCYLLGAVGKAVAVNPDLQMRRVAIDKKWQVVKTL